MDILNLLVSEEVWWGLPKKLEFLKTIVNAIESVLWPILIVVATVGSIYAIYLGINMAKAEESGKRDEARKHLINAVIAMAVTVVMILLINLVIIPNIPGWVANNDVTSSEVNKYATGKSRDEIEARFGLAYSGDEWHLKVDGKNKTYYFSEGANAASTEDNTFNTTKPAA